MSSAVAYAMPLTLLQICLAISPEAFCITFSSPLKSSGETLSCGSGGTYFTPPNKTRLVFSPIEVVFSAPRIIPFSVRTAFEYLPIISKYSRITDEEKSETHFKSK